MAGETILVVDDAPVNLKLAAAVLRSEYYKVHLASSAEEALVTLRTMLPDLLLLDLQLPGMNGLELAQLLRQDSRTRTMLIVALTATCVGYALASVLPYMLTVIVTQAIVVFVFMFSPLTFLPDKLPGWLEVIHSLLPIQAMGEVTRGTIAPHEFGLPMGAFLTLGVWCILGFAVTYAAMTRRG